MDIRIILGVFAASLLFAYFIYFIIKKTSVSAKVIKIIFGVLLVMSIIVLAISYMIGGWTGLGLGALSIYVGVPSLTTLIVITIKDRH
ncbi:YesK-like protein [Streptohalobacillus salinus]|uniref:YesK-like protein n=1 Tax=Streptohalobacillus salinus TaxID=621096 RepID=A0A2V3WHZ5_9BACI|nr:hypothetical protein [Streptohalobacillus salinus]PXW93164.1 YesK-like protein [Streptohalobacillus salinus]